MSVVPPDVGLLSMCMSIISDVFTLFGVASCFIANICFLEIEFTIHYRVSFLAYRYAPRYVSIRIESNFDSISLSKLIVKLLSIPFNL